MSEFEFKIFSSLKKIIESKNLTMRVTSDSMNPLIKKKNTITVGRINKEVKKFDIIVFRNSTKRLTVHYIYKIKENYQNNQTYYITKGLNSSHLDTPIQNKDILGFVLDFRISGTYKIILILKHFFFA